MNVIASIVAGVASGVILILIERFVFQRRWPEAPYPEAQPVRVAEGQKDAQAHPPHPTGAALQATSLPNPRTAFLLSLLLFGGAGQVYLGQTKKGVLLIALSLAACYPLLSVGLWTLIPVLGTVDAYRTAQRLRRGEHVGEWDFSLDVKTVLLAVPVSVGIVICMGLALMLSGYG